MTQIAIIGAGLAGLTLAHQLQDVAQVSVFEKARGVGGRMSTRRAEPYAFDHGAQYFTARTSQFQDFLTPFIDNGVVQRWDARHAQINSHAVTASADWAEDEPRYVAVPQMNSLGKAIMAELSNVDLQTANRIVALHQQDGWCLENENSVQPEQFDWVISTAPVPQTIELLPANTGFFDVLNSIEMIPCMALMVGFDSPILMPFDAAHVENSVISWIALNSSKPGRPDGCAVLIHSSEQFARDNIGCTDQEAVCQALIAEAEKITGTSLDQSTHHALHGWRYANNASRQQYEPLIDSSLRLAACGDWTEGGRVEGAFVSAFKVAQQLKALL